MVGHLSASDSIKGTLREGSFTGKLFFFFFLFFLEPEDQDYKSGDHLEFWWNNRAPIN
jgi:hypothetical protein